MSEVIGFTDLNPVETTSSRIQRGVDVVFATPSLSHSVSMAYLRSMIQSEWILGRYNITTAHTQRPGDCFVAKVRNKMASDFLRDFPECDNLFFVDDDVGWANNPDAPLRFLQCDADIVAGVYPKRSNTLDFPVALAVDNTSGQLVEQSGFVMAQMAPTGFMRIKRRVLETLATKVETFLDQEVGGGYREFWSFFDAGIGPDRRFWGEDYVFCVRARECGFSIWVDPSITFTHMGLNTWEQRLGDHLDVFRERAKRAIDGSLSDHSVSTQDIDGLRVVEFRTQQKAAHG